jgi:CHAT domain-containing protein
MQIVAVAEAPRLPPLPGVTAEADRLAQFFPGARELRNAAATPQAVLEGLADASWVHFACHATNDADPTRSYLSVHDGEVLVADVLASRSSTGNSPKGELAYLSACQTAASAPEAHVPDEVIHLGSAFQVGGFRHVVGTLWSVSDSTAAQTARLFYSGLGTPASADRAPFAWHHAVQEVRRRYPLLPTRWAPYIHLGP